jgi:hypothetical protein
LLKLLDRKCLGGFRKWQITTIGSSTVVRQSFTKDTWYPRLQQNGQRISSVERSPGQVKMYSTSPAEPALSPVWQASG